MRQLIFFSGPALACALGIGLATAGQPSEVCWTAGITLLCAIWWVAEPIPIPITALLPLAVFPLVGVLTPNQVGQAYGSPLILLYLGGFMLSMAMEKSGAHRRLALGMVNLFGGGGARTGLRLHDGSRYAQYVDLEYGHEPHAVADRDSDARECEG